MLLMVTVDDELLPALSVAIKVYVPFELTGYVSAPLLVVVSSGFLIDVKPLPLSLADTLILMAPLVHAVVDGVAEIVGAVESILVTVTDAVFWLLSLS